MAGPFKLKSGNNTPFKQMGSSPAKQLGSILGRKYVYDPKTNTTNVYNRKGRLINTKYHGKKTEKEISQEIKKEEIKSNNINIDNKNEQNVNITGPETRDDVEGDIKRDVKPPNGEGIERKPIRPPKKPKPPKKTPDEDTKRKKEKTRPTSWWRGEEGWIPDELQPWVNRPEVPVKKKK